MATGGVIRRLVRDPALVRIEAGFALFAVTEHATWLATTVFAYERGGVGEAGVVASAMLVPAALLAPLVSFLGDRFPRDRVLAGGYAAQALACVLTAVTMASGAPALVAYLSAALVAASVTVTRPVFAGMLPAIAREPADLTAANALAGFVTTAGLFAGPAAAAAILAAGDPWVVFAFGGAATGLATIVSLGLRVAGTGTEVDDLSEATSAALLAGWRVLRDEPAPRLVILLVVGVFVITGALDVAFVTIAVELLERDEAIAGVLSASVGVGGFLGSFAGFALVGRRSLARPLAAGALVIGVAIAAMAGVTALPVMVGLFLVVGLGTVLTDVAGRTMLQGLTADDVLARVFGLLEGLMMVGLAAGSMLFAALAVATSPEIALVVVGAILPVAVVWNLRRLQELDRRRPQVAPGEVAFLRSVPLFAALPPFRVEQIAVNLHRRPCAAGEVVVQAGDVGDRFHLIEAGSVEVELAGGRAVELGAGDYFGEIALLHDVPRTATVRAGAEGAELRSLDRDVFLEAITSYPRSHGRAHDEAARRLADGA